MEKRKIVVRPAVAADAPFIGLVVLMALHYDETHPMYDIFKELAGRDDSQYSYRNALVAEVDGVPAGAVVGYDGANLHVLREPLLELVELRMGKVLEIEDETSAGEFYVDSIAVLPEYRGRGVGRALLADLCRRVFAKGFDKVGLLVDVTNPKAENLYASLGFRRVNPTTFLGLDMWHMQKKMNLRND
ncbi:MAG: GNAT family N-acetyltransferase [Bacteroidaceae bacterium]|nr:GNAT family N-acetyltransferase [Bacteroidaceae bacterium]